MGRRFIIFIILAAVVLQHYIKANNNYKFDLTVLGEINYNGGLTRIGLSIVQSLHPYLKINYIRTPRRKIDLSPFISKEVKNIILQHDYSPGKVALFVDTFDNYNAKKIYQNVKSKIKIAYTMLESTLIPKNWVASINNYFDAIVVPDDFLVNVYKNSGVTVPIFVIPLCMDLKPFLKMPLKMQAHSPFTFGVAATYIPRKNNIKLLRAFIQEFGNDTRFLLKMHGRYGQESQFLKDELKRSKIQNVKISDQPLSQKKYINFLKSIDCYVYISKGEGFSLTPREAMALGIPCIITDNTAQSTICKSGLVKIIKSNIKVPFFLRGSFSGYCFDCNIADVKNSMRHVYNNYLSYTSKSYLMRNWVKNYDISSLSKFFLMLVKPKKVILGNKDFITKDFMVTTSKALYQKYIS